VDKHEEPLKLEEDEEKEPAEKPVEKPEEPLKLEEEEPEEEVLEEKPVEAEKEEPRGWDPRSHSHHPPTHPTHPSPADPQWIRQVSPWETTW
jgi:hypothetical protein